MARRKIKEENLCVVYNEMHAEISGVTVRAGENNNGLFYGAVYEVEREFDVDLSDIDAVEDAADELWNDYGIPRNKTKSVMEAASVGTSVTFFSEEDLANNWTGDWHIAVCVTFSCIPEEAEEEE